jgi:hypothetical protein
LALPLSSLLLAVGVTFAIRELRSTSTRTADHEVFQLEMMNPPIEVDPPASVCSARSTPAWIGS